MTTDAPSLADDGTDELLRGWHDGLGPDPDLSVSAWSDRYRFLSPRGANEAGPWRTGRTPYLRELMDALSPRHPAQRVVFMKGSQLGASESGCNWIGYVIHHAPGPMLAVQPIAGADRWSERKWRELEMQVAPVTPKETNVADTGAREDALPTAGRLAAPPRRGRRVFRSSYLS